MQLTDTEKAREYINNVNGDFCMQLVADAIGCDRIKIASLTKTLKKQGSIQFSEIKPLVKGGHYHAFYIRIKKIKITPRPSKKISINTNSPWHQFCFKSHINTGKIE